MAFLPRLSRRSSFADVVGLSGIYHDPTCVMGCTDAFGEGDEWGKAEKAGQELRLAPDLRSLPHSRDALPTTSEGPQKEADRAIAAAGHPLGSVYVQQPEQLPERAAVIQPRHVARSFLGPGASGIGSKTAVGRSGRWGSISVPSAAADANIDGRSTVGSGGRWGSNAGPSLAATSAMSGSSLPCGISEKPSAGSSHRWGSRPVPSAAAGEAGPEPPCMSSGTSSGAGSGNSSTGTEMDGSCREAGGDRPHLHHPAATSGQEDSNINAGSQSSCLEHPVTAAPASGGHAPVARSGGKGTDVNTEHPSYIKWRPDSAGPASSCDSFKSSRSTIQEEADDVSSGRARFADAIDLIASGTSEVRAAVASHLLTSACIGLSCLPETQTHGQICCISASPLG
jgi:hypothetical protein